MTDPLFLLDDIADPFPTVGARLTLAGDEGRHAAVVRRIQPGEMIMIGNGRGTGVRGVVVEVRGAGLVVEVLSHLTTTAEPRCFVAAQALAKGDRSELAVEMLTEMGISEILPWQAARSIVRWSGERGVKGLARWRSTAREAAKQSRRLWAPTVAEPIDTTELATRIAAADIALLLHEDATTPVAAARLPAAGEVLLVVGPEGGISPDELAALTAAGGQPTLLTPHVLRTSTAGVVACAGLMLRGVTENRTSTPRHAGDTPSATS